MASSSGKVCYTGVTDPITYSQAGISWPVQEETSDPVAKFFQPGSVSGKRNHVRIEWACRVLSAVQIVLLIV